MFSLYQFKLKVWQIEWGAGAMPLRGGAAPTPPFATFTIQIGIKGQSKDWIFNNQDRIKQINPHKNCQRSVDFWQV
jgi:hypothetical protein